MQQQSGVEQNYESRIIEQNNLLEEKDFLINLLDLAMDDQRHGKKNQKNVSIHPDDLFEVIKYIKKLWNYCLKLDEENCSIRNNQQYEPYSSIIISQSDHSSMQQQEDFSNQFIEKHLFQYAPFKLVHIQFENLPQYQSWDKTQGICIKIKVTCNKGREIKMQSINNIILEINEKMVWLDNIIKSSSLLSNKQSDHSKLSEGEFDLYQEQGKVKQTEDSQNQEDNHSNASTVEKFKSMPTPEELRAVKVLYKTIVQNLEENSQIQDELQNCEAEIKSLKKKITEQSTMINKLQDIKRNKNQELSANKMNVSKKQRRNPEENADTLFNSIKYKHNEIIKIIQINQESKINEKSRPNNQIQNDQTVTLSLMDLNKIQQRSQGIVEQAESLQSLVQERDQQIRLLESQTEDYKYFIIMGVLERESYNLPRLSQEMIKKIWDNLKIPDDKANIEIIKILKFNQQTYFKWQDYEDPEIFWASFYERQLNQLHQIDVLLTNLIKIQKTALNLLSISKRKQFVQKIKNEQLSYLQFIEKEIQYKGLSQVKSNIQLIIDSLK